MKKILAIAALVCTSAHADFRDGNKLLAEMRGTTFEQGMSLGYVMAVADAGGGINHCIPATVTAGQIQDMTRNMLDKTPAVRHLPASLIIEYVLKDVWPCSKKGSSL